MQNLSSAVNKFLIVILLCALQNNQKVNSVKIDKIDVPNLVYLHEPFTVLDCVYHLEENESSDLLVVKWFFNNQPGLIYQWIPERKPAATGILKGRVDLDYKPIDDPNATHVALKIIRLGQDLTGNYTCVVSTFAGEDKKTKKMTVLALGSRQSSTSPATLLLLLFIVILTNYPN